MTVTPQRVLPRWPVAVVLVGFPVWWLVGVVDFIWIPIAALMVGLLIRHGPVEIPRPFVAWLVFLAWAAASAVAVLEAADLLTLTYRLLLYAAAGVLFVYVFNAREALTARYVFGCLTAFWMTVVVGGYLGVLFPEVVFRTPMSVVLPQGLVNHPFVNQMVVQRLTQYNPDSFLQVAPRPSAPFAYTNNWGNAYSLLTPIVLTYLSLVRRERRFWWLAALVPISLVPAFLTLNRGMFLGLGVAAAYIGIRAALAGRPRVLGAVIAMAVLSVALVLALPVGERLNQRLDTDRATTTSTEARASLYEQSLEAVNDSPLFGYGAPQVGANPDAAPVGTQGQFWMVLVSHGWVGLVTFVGWFVMAFCLAWPRRDPVGLACSAVILVATMELLYYGALPHGLPITMIAAAIVFRGLDRSSTPPLTRHAATPASRR